MKNALTLITAPMALSFLAGMFDWTLPDGLYVLIGFTMIGGLIWAWIIEAKN